MTPQAQDERYPPGAESDQPQPPDCAESDSGASLPPEKKRGNSTSSDTLAEILTGVYRAEGMTAQGFAALRERLVVIEEKLGIEADVESDTTAIAESRDVGTNLALAGPAAKDLFEGNESVPTDESASVETFPEVAPVNPPATAESQLPPMAQPVTPSPQPMPQPVQPVLDVRPVATPGTVATTSGDLEAMFFGQDFAQHASLLPHRQGLLAAARQGQEDAIGLLGQLLIVRSAAMDRLPTLLKDVGEAWYRWQGEDSSADPLRDALIAWLHTRLEGVGLGNRIDLVRMGDRYDSKRHNAKSRGVEVTGVQGWVVLRDNGNVYTKANVTVA